MEVAVEQKGDLVLRNAAAGIRHGQKHPPGDKLQLHRDGAPGRREFEGVGEQLIDQLLDGEIVERTDVMGGGAAELQPDVPQIGQTLGGVADHLDGLHHVPVPNRKGTLLPQRAGHVQIVHQTQQLIVALIQQGGLGIQLRTVPRP